MGFCGIIVELFDQILYIIIRKHETVVFYATDRYDGEKRGELREYADPPNGPCMIQRSEPIKNLVPTVLRGNEGDPVSKL
jgi:hypothetical protein